MNFRMRGLLGAVCLFNLVSCGTNPETAFPTAQTLAARTGAGDGANIAVLERGRKIYTTSCTECHVARTIANYSVTQWHHYIGIMAPRAGLSGDDRAAVESYVVAARESVPPSTTSSSR
jgi:mono/diheme cytochrome c family protein